MLKNKCLLLVLLISLFSFGFATAPAAEAAAPKVAVLPLINLGEENPALTGILSDLTVKTFPYPQYDLLQDDKVIEAAQKAGYFEWGKKGVDTQKLEALRQQLGADILVMTLVEKTSAHSPAVNSSLEEIVETEVRMQNAAVYSTGKPLVEKTNRSNQDMYSVVKDQGSEKMVKQILTAFIHKVVGK